MRRVALRGLLARKTRLALTALAVALGVTLISGTYVFTDTINASFANIFSQAYKTTDVVITPNDEVALSENGGDLPPIDGAVLDRVRAIDGVENVEGSIFDQGGTFLTRKGEPFAAQGPKFVASAFDDERFGGFSYAEGRRPQADGEVAIDKATARREAFAVGDRFEIQAETPKKAYTISGLTQVAGVDSYGGAAVALLTLPEAQRITAKPGKYDEIDLTVSEGQDADAVTAAIRAALPRSVDVRTGEAEAADQTAEIRDDLGFLQTGLLAFAGVSLFVGAFIIFNTFSITVAQRAREFALLRTLGASRAQVLRAVLGEGIVLGVLGSIVGLGLGILVADGLRALFKAFGFELPSTGTVLEARTVYVSLAVGVIVTLLSCLAPALRATRVPPVAALREGVALPESRSSRLAFPLALALTGLGVIAMVVGLFAGLDESPALLCVGLGAAATFLGVALLSPKLVGPIASVVGRPVEALFGVTGRLARENTVRQPGRTAVTAAALMVGVALVAFATIFAAGGKSTIDAAIDAGLRGQAVLQNQDGFSPFAAGATERVARLDGVERVAAVRFVQARVAREDVAVTGVDTQTFPALYRTALPPLSDDETVVSKGYAEEQGIRVGDAVAVTTAAARRLELRVAGIVEDKGRLLDELTVSNDLVAREFGQKKDSLVIVGYTGGDTTKAAIDRAIKTDFPQVEALTAEEFKSDQAGQVDQLLVLVYALLALTVIVAMFGIVNTLVLSVTERTRELGMMRAIGTSRRQVRRVIRYEAVITAQIGGVLGIVLGVLLALLVSRTIDDFSLTIPYVLLFGLFVAAGIAGVVAAVLPARRASRLDVLEALAYE
ncbi:MAG: FtsX-like permease family protein [Actinomycetota bacterium]|nr:FtsX-like permease family protein [Actinomycetota bacterium]